MRRTRLAASAVAVAAASALALAACGSSTTSSAGGTTASKAPDCAPASLKLTTAGMLTIGTDNPAYEPWFKDNTPSNGQGYEAAMAYAIADKMGFPKDKVTWVVAPFNAVTTGAARNFDFDVNQVSINDERKKAVDFSSGYYDVRQAIVTYKGSPIDGKTSIADLAGAKFGAQIGTTSYKAIVDQIKPTTKPAVYNDNDLAVQALKNKQIDGIVADLPTAFFMSAAQLDNGVIVGQLPSAGAQPEQFGAVLTKGSPLTACVTKAVDALRADGTIDKLVAQWLSAAGAPELK
ncbi:MAG: ABC transporter substrate-binding protein [Candidatus Lutibacillus vidarii]|jgi:polar amino acid transport system substrate-binding protein|nr:amino acid ABC transporter substrate-binding protein [Candidatus Lutibacillus vidarii]HON74673.1 ABC transporter substrate-binding protein [Dermatophilaceae bacterium]HRB99028.1 ABC transporter substrate-binding protein [Dermatophilaceae bacterium]